MGTSRNTDANRSSPRCLLDYLRACRIWRDRLYARDIFETPWVLLRFRKLLTELSQSSFRCR